MDDEKIISLFWERNEDAIRQTEQKYGKYCYTVANNVLHSHEDSLEAVNDTLSGAWNTIPPQRPSNLRSFLGRIARNIAIDRYRRSSAKKRGAEIESIIDEFWECIPSAETEISDELTLKAAIDGFLSSLDKQSRIIFMRRYWYSMSVKDIARGMDLSVSNVNVILHRTRSKFREYLMKEGIFV